MCMIYREGVCTPSVHVEVRGNHCGAHSILSPYIGSVIKLRSPCLNSIHLSLLSHLLGPSS